MPTLDMVLCDRSRFPLMMLQLDSDLLVYEKPSPEGRSFEQMEAKFERDRWYSPMEAVQVLEPRHGANAKALIADKLKDGLLKAHATRIWNSSHPTLNKAWREREEAFTDTDDAGLQVDVAVEKTLWRSSRHWAFDQANWRWPENRFVITRRKNPADRTIIEGVHFSKDDIDYLSRPIKSRSGRKPNYNGYANLFCAILELEREKLLTVEVFPRRAALEARLLEMHHDGTLPSADQLDDDTLKRCASAVWARVIDPQR